MYLVFDIGGTKTRIAASNDLHTLSEPIIFPTSKSYDEGIKIFAEKCKEISQGQSIKAVAGGITGPLNKEKSLSLISPNLPDWSQRTIKQDLNELLNAPIFIENDAHLFGLGEAGFGSGKDFNIIVFLTVSTGVGGVRITNKKIDPSALGFEPGHQIIIPDGLPCGCGGKGHLESYVSGSALEKIYHRPPETIEDESVWEQVTRYLAIGLNNTIVHWSPDVIILGGGVSERIDLDLLNKYLKKYVTIFPSLPIIERATLGDLGGLYGALEYLKQH